MREPPQSFPHLVTRAELAQALKVPVSWIDRAVAERRLPGVLKMGHRTVRFDLQKVEQWLATIELAPTEVRHHV